MPLDQPIQPSELPEEQPTPAAPAPDASDRLLLERMAASGRDVSAFKNDEEFLGVLETGYEQLQEVPNLRRELEAHKYAATQYWENADKLEGKSEPTPTEPEPSKPAYNPPEVDDNVMRLLERDKNGVYRAPSGYEYLAGAAAQANKRAQYERQFFDGLKKNPTEWTYNVLRDKFEEQRKTIKEEVLAELARQRAIDEQNERIMSHKDDLFLVGEDGQIQTMIDPQTGQAVYRQSEKGMLVQQFVQQAQQMGIPSEHQFQWAMDQADLYDHRYGQQKQEAPEAQPDEAPEPTPAPSRKEEFLDDQRRIPSGAGRATSRAGTGDLDEMNDAPINSSLTFLEMYNQEAAKRGVPGVK